MMIRQGESINYTNLATKYLKESDFEYCNCLQCPLSDRIKIVAQILSDVDSYCGKEELLTVTSIGSGYLGTEHALISALLSLGYREVKMELVDIIYQKTAPYVSSEGGAMIVNPEGRSITKEESPEVGFHPAKGPITGIDMADLLVRFFRSVQKSSGEHKAKVSVDFSSSIDAQIVKNTAVPYLKTHSVVMCIDVNPDWLEPAADEGGNYPELSDYDRLKSGQKGLTTDRGTFMAIYEMAERTSRDLYSGRVVNVPETV